MLYFCWFLMVELVEGVIDIPWHQNVNIPFFIMVCDRIMFPLQKICNTDNAIALGRYTNLKPRVCYM